MAKRANLLVQIHFNSYLDITGKPQKVRSIEYNEGFCKKDGNLKWK